MKTFLKKVAAVALIALASAGAVKAETPDATVSMSGGHVGLGYSWGKGVLHYHGKDYPFHIVGLAAGDVGASNFKAEGNVYKLDSVADFEGKFDTLNAGTTVAAGGALAVEENVKGVQIRLNTKSQGLDVSFGIGGMRTKFDEPVSE